MQTTSPGETWQFTVQPGTADKVYLVVDSPSVPSKWIEMHPLAGSPDTWSVVTDIAPGKTRARYFTQEAGAYLNCGNVGLHAVRTSQAKPDANVEDLGLVA